MISDDDLMKMSDLELPMKTLVDAYVDGTRFMHKFSREIMWPLLKMLLVPSPQEVATRDIYVRMILMVGSAAALNNFVHVQTLASVARSLFEQWLDLKIIASLAVPGAVEKYDRFPEIERYRVAEQLIRYSDNSAVPMRVDIEVQRRFVADQDRTNRIQQSTTMNRNGKRLYPDHWSRLNVRERARLLGQESMYVDSYPLLSWQVHSGGVATAGLSEDSLKASFGYSHSLIQRIFVDATSSCAKVTKIAQLDYFEEWMNSIELKTGQILLSEQMKLLDERRRAANGAPTSSTS
jgi:hypothetical protein